MSRIKTRESVKDIKVIDENLMDDGQVTPSEYAEDKIRYAAEDVADRVGHDVSAETKKAVNKGKEAYRKHREEKRIEKNEERVNRYEERFRREEPGRNWPEPRRLLLRNLIHMNRLHDPQSRRDLRNRGVSLHPNGKLSLRSKTLFGRGRMSTSRTPSERQHPPAVKSERTLYAELEIRPSKQRSERNTRLSSPPVLSERRP